MEEDLPYQCGSKRAGAASVVHVVQQSLFQNPHSDLFSADASKAYYNLNWDLFKKRLEEKAPGAFNLHLGESKGSTDAFFYVMLEGVRCVSQVEGGVQRQPRRTRDGLWI